MSSPVMNPLPVPVGFAAKILNDVPQVDGTIPKQMCTLEFYTCIGANVYFMDKAALSQLIKGLQDIKSKMTDSGKKLEIAREMPHG